MSCLLWGKPAAMLGGHSSSLVFKWGGTGASRRQPALTHQGCEWVTLETHPLAPAKPLEDCSLSWCLTATSGESLSQSYLANLLPNSESTDTVWDNKYLLFKRLRFGIMCCKAIDSSYSFLSAILTQFGMCFLGDFMPMSATDLEFVFAFECWAVWNHVRVSGQSLGRHMLHSYIWEMSVFGSQSTACCKSHC